MPFTVLFNHDYSPFPELFHHLSFLSMLKHNVIFHGTCYFICIYSQYTLLVVFFFLASIPYNSFFSLFKRWGLYNTDSGLGAERKIRYALILHWYYCSNGCKEKSISSLSLPLFTLEKDKLLTPTNAYNLSEAARVWTEKKQWKGW